MIIEKNNGNEKGEKESWAKMQKKKTKMMVVKKGKKRRKTQGNDKRDTRAKIKQIEPR